MQHPNTRYSRRVMPDGVSLFCVQCCETGRLVKSPDHNYRPYIKAHEIPKGAVIHDFDELAGGRDYE